MIKVFLVEDEKIIRKSIKNNVKWEENGFEFAGEAPDGEMALPMIEKLHPDIVITDIKMPFMDGLELSDILKKKMPKIQIIILSGYGEFDYAKEAIKIGVTDYLTKPVTGEQLLEALNKVKQKLDKKKRQEEDIKKYKKI
jgi:two-component system response regulator YesN